MHDARKEYFPALTGLRAVAVFLVLVHHFNPISPAQFGWRLHSLAAETHVGVTVFFVLSGFLISYRYLGAGPVALRTYFINRFARIYPLYFLLTTLTFVLVASKSAAPWAEQLGQYLLNISFLRGFFEEYIYTGIAQGWSLTVEEMFYATAPAAFWFLRRSRHWLWGLPLTLTAAGVGLVLLCRGQAWHGFFGSFDFLFQFTYLGRAVEFFVGIGLAWWLRQSLALELSSRSVYTYVGLVGSLACLLMLSLLHGPVVGALGVFRPAGMFINNVLLPLLGIGPLLWGLVQEQTWVSRLLSSAPLVLLGKSSYAFYLIHLGVLQELLRDWLPNAVVPMLLLYVVSVLLYLLIEEPLNRWLRRVLRPASARHIEEALKHAPRTA